MTISEYFDTVKAHLLTDSLITNFQIIRERRTLVDGHIRSRLTLVDGSIVEFSKYVRRISSGAIEIVTYSYHWADDQGNLIRRWDNAPHFPELSNFPHHVHDGTTNTVRCKYTTASRFLQDLVGNLSWF